MTPIPLVCMWPCVPNPRPTSAVATVLITRFENSSQLNSWTRSLLFPFPLLSSSSSSPLLSPPPRPGAGQAPQPTPLPLRPPRAPGRRRATAKAPRPFPLPLPLPFPLPLLPFVALVLAVEVDVVVVVVLVSSSSVFCQTPSECRLLTRYARSMMSQVTVMPPASPKSSTLDPHPGTEYSSVMGS